MKALKDDVIVDPLYDPDTVQSGMTTGEIPKLYMPNVAQNPISQQGIIVSVGPAQWYLRPGDHILYHPFVGWPFKRDGYEYLMVQARNIVGWLDHNGELYPLPTDVVVLPHFKPAGRPTQQGLLWLPKQVFDIDVPCTGTVVRRGELVTSVTPGQRVLFPHDAGREIGLKQVWYTIPEAELLAVIEKDVEVSLLTEGQWLRS